MVMLAGTHTLVLWHDDNCRTEPSIKIEDEVYEVFFRRWKKSVLMNLICVFLMPREIFYETFHSIQ